MLQDLTQIPKPDDDPLEGSAETRRRLGNVSDMWIVRRLHDDETFPRPTYIGRRRFWRRSEVNAWIARQRRG